MRILITESNHCVHKKFTDNLLGFSNRKSSRSKLAKKSNDVI